MITRKGKTRVLTSTNIAWKTTTKKKGELPRTKQKKKGKRGWVEGESKRLGPGGVIKTGGGRKRGNGPNMILLGRKGRSSERPKKKTARCGREFNPLNEPLDRVLKGREGLCLGRSMRGEWLYSIHSTREKTKKIMIGGGYKTRWDGALLAGGRDRGNARRVKKSGRVHGGGTLAPTSGYYRGKKRDMTAHVPGGGREVQICKKRARATA